MDNKCEFTENLINQYANLKIEKEYGSGANEKDIKLRQAMKEITAQEAYAEVRKEIYNIEKDKIIEDGKKELKDIEYQRKRKQIKFILLEGMILSLIVGLLGNEVTDIISYLKGDTNYQATGILIFILLLVSIIFAFLVYIDKIEEFFDRKE